MNNNKEASGEGVIGTVECPFKQQAGSYYDPLPWDTCAKMPSLVSNENEMCDIDAGAGCRFVAKPGEEPDGYGDDRGTYELHGGYR